MYSVGFIQPEMNAESSTIQLNTIAIGLFFYSYLVSPTILYQYYYITNIGKKHKL